jgi:hypothetical protein
MAALFAAMLFVLIAAAGPARADDPVKVIDCWDPALEAFIPCDDIVPDESTPANPSSPASASHGRWARG